MMKRLFAALLCVVLMAALLPKTALADKPPYVQIWDSTCKLSSSAQYYHNGSDGDKGVVNNIAEGANAHYDPSAGVLTLTNLSCLNSNDLCAIFADGDIRIVLIGTNEVSTASNNRGLERIAVKITGQLIIEGSGTLTATAGNAANTKESTGVLAGSSIILNSGSLTGRGGTVMSAGGTFTNTGMSCGVRTENGSISVRGGSLMGRGGRTNKSGGSFGVYAGTDGASDISAGQDGTIMGMGGTIEDGSYNGSYITYGVSCGIFLQNGSICAMGSNGNITGIGGIITGTARSYGMCVYGRYLNAENGCYLHAAGGTISSEDPEAKSYGIYTGTNAICAPIYGSTTLVQGYTKAFNATPTLYADAKAKAVVSDDYTGNSSTRLYNDTDQNYKYFLMPAAISQTTISQSSFPRGQAPDDLTVTVIATLAGFNATDYFDSATMGRDTLNLGSVGSPGTVGSVNTGSITSGGVTNGTIEIHLNKAYLDTLYEGTYILTVNFKGVYADRCDQVALTVTPPVPTVTGVAVNPASVRIQKGGSQTFRATVTGTNSPAQTVTWSVTGKTSASTGMNADGLLSVGSDEQAQTLTVTATSTVDTAKSGTATVTLTELPPTVTLVTVTPASAHVPKCGSQSFSAAVTGTNNPAQTVTWSVTGKTSASTAISASGVLSVGCDEQAQTLTVTATSTVDTAKSGTASVTVTACPPALLSIIRGQNGTWIKGSRSGLSFTADGDYANFTDVSVDGTAISGGNYTSRSGSTIVTLKPSYLETLSLGRHTLRIHFGSSYAETSFTVITAGGPADIPKTGDCAQPMIWLSIMLLAGAGLAASVVSRRRRQNG